MHEGHRNRKREQALRNNFQNLEIHEVLELLLYHSIPRADTNPVAHKLINRFGGFSNVFDAERSELLSVDGVGERTAFLLKLIPEVIRQYEIGKNKKRISIASRDEVFGYVKSLFVSSKVEQFYCICVSSGKNIVSTRMMNSGFVDKVDVSVNEIIKEAIDKKASGIIIAHNHPFGHPVFSADDVKFTSKLIEALTFFDLDFIDHFVVAADKCVSYIDVCT